jgi:hypothetical protein
MSTAPALASTKTLAPSSGEPAMHCTTFAAIAGSAMNTAPRANAAMASTPNTMRFIRIS